jgi:hypothetical protein
MMHPEDFSFRRFVSTEKPKFSEWEVVKMYFNDETKVKEIAEKSGLSIAEIYRTIRRYGVGPNRLITNHNNVHLFAHAGLPVRNIAELTGYTPRNVRYILNNQERQ